jgi:hypothetical protein
MAATPAEAAVLMSATLMRARLAAAPRRRQRQLFLNLEQARGSFRLPRVGRSRRRTSDAATAAAVVGPLTTLSLGPRAAQSDFDRQSHRGRHSLERG